MCLQLLTETQNITRLVLPIHRSVDGNPFIDAQAREVRFHAEFPQLIGTDLGAHDRLALQDRRLPL